MRTLFKKAARCFAEIGASCPYTMVGRKVVQSARGELKQKPKISSGRENELAARMKTGRNIALIGVFCPFFWYSLLSGAPAEDVRFNAMHSGIVVVIGLAIMLKTRWDLTAERKCCK